MDGTTLALVLASMALALAMFETLHLRKTVESTLEEVRQVYGQEIARLAQEREALLDRLQAKTLAEYRHLTGVGGRPQVRNPMRRLFAPADAVPDGPAAEVE